MLMRAAGATWGERIRGDVLLEAHAAMKSLSRYMRLETHSR